MITRFNDFARATLTLTLKDLRTELRTRRLIGSMGLFALMAVLVFYFGLQAGRSVLVTVLPAILWAIIVFASTLGLSRTLSAEKEAGSLDALLLAPIPRAALFYGKFLATWLYSLIVALIVCALLSLLFNIVLFAPGLLIVLLLGTAGFSTTGTLIGAIAVNADGRETALPILLLPVALPIIIAATRATADIVAGLPPSDWLAWLPPLVGVDVIFLVLALFLFDVIVEE